MSDDLCAEALRLADDMHYDVERGYVKAAVPTTLRALVAAHDALLAEVIGLREERDGYAADRVAINQLQRRAYDEMEAAIASRDAWRERAERAEAALWTLNAALWARFPTGPAEGAILSPAWRAAIAALAAAQGERE